MNLVTVTFDQAIKASVTSTVISDFSNLDDDKLPALAKTPVFSHKNMAFNKYVFHKNCFENRTKICFLIDMLETLFTM